MRDKKVGFSLGAGYVVVDGKIVKSESATLAKLDLCARLRRKHSKRVRVKPVAK
jgi:hypothetical protein